MPEHVIKLPDVGEGVAEAELVEWHVKVGDLVREDTLLAAVMTDKATVEIPSPVDGEVAWLGAQIGDVVAVGAPIVRIETGGKSAAAEVRMNHENPSPALRVTSPQRVEEPKPDDRRDLPESRSLPPLGGGVTRRVTERGQQPRTEGKRALASPAVRLRAREAGVDLRQVPASGPAGRTTHEDLDAFLARGPQGAPTSRKPARTEVEEIKVIGLRRRIAEKMTLAASRIPHITYVEEVDMTALEALRKTLNGEKKPSRPKLTILPFLMRAMARAIDEQPVINAHFDDEAGVLRRFAGIHVGIATQTANGLVVPVVRHVEAADLWACASEVARLVEAAKAGSIAREDLSGSTVTITSLGAMGGIATTPIINHPEVAIVGVNKMVMRPHWDGNAFVPRMMMNLSSSFDHRVVDGWDAAVFVQRLKLLLETPALIFVED